MVVYTFLTEGPEITITFESAEGIEAGKTKIKRLNVELGVVQSVELSKDLDKVVVVAQLERFAIPLLRDDTQFWVMRARVGPGGVSGLGTILSGGYIQLSPGVGKEGARKFIGLENPPVTPVGTPGLNLELYSERAGSVSAGDPILYQGYRVGLIEEVRFDPESGRIVYRAFIDEPYENLVTANTRFWNSSGVSINASAAGVDVNIGSLQTLLIGGVEFDLPENETPGRQAQDGDTFQLFASRDSISTVEYRAYFDAVVSFSQSLSGLLPGAPVEYRGIRVGTVQRIMLDEFFSEDEEPGSPIPVLIRFEPARLGLPDTQESADGLAANVKSNVSRGLRATLQTGNLLTGNLLVNFDYYEDIPAATVDQFAGYTELPTLAGGIERIEMQVNQLLTKLNRLPLEPVVEELDSVLKSLRRTLDGLPPEEGEATAASLSVTLRELNATLDSFSPDSEQGERLQRSLAELSIALRSLEDLARQLSDQPSSIIFSPPVEEDPVPEAGVSR
jgi:paraquat-inducible protein B